MPDADRSAQPYEVESVEVIAMTPDLRVSVFTLAEGHEVPWHVHSNVVDTFYCLSGRISVHHGARPIVHLTKGESHAVPARTPHRVEGPGRFLLVQGIGAYDFVPTDAPKAARESDADVQNDSNPFVCDIEALTSEQRERHGALARRLRPLVLEFVELAGGYAARFDAAPGRLAEVAEFMELERLCCPFFVLELKAEAPVEAQAGGLSLIVTGPEGVKPFIRAEFAIPGA